MRNLTKVILLAQNELIKNPSDLVHDIRHHYQVYLNCMEVVEKEKLHLDFNVLEICSWWHDVGRERGGVVSKKLLRALKQNGFDKEFINKCEEVINNHSFGKKQKSLESKVFFDADKLEYVNPLRFQQLIRAVEDGYISKEKAKRYKSEWFKRTKQVGKMLHFSFTKKKFFSLYKKAEKIICRIPI